MQKYVKEFMEEVERIDKFYMKMYDEYRLEYETLGHRFIQKNIE